MESLPVLQRGWRIINLTSGFVIREVCLPGPEHERRVHVDGGHATNMANFFGNHPQLLKVHQAVHFRVIAWETEEERKWTPDNRWKNPNRAGGLQQSTPYIPYRHNLLVQFAVTKIKDSWRQWREAKVYDAKSLFDVITFSFSFLCVSCSLKIYFLCVRWKFNHIISGISCISLYIVMFMWRTFM